MIETSDRGITLNKTLAWGMLVSLVSLVWYGGTTVSSLQSATENLESAILEMRANTAADREAATRMADRVRALETNASRAGAEFVALREGFEEVKQEQRETNSLLRQYLHAPNP